MDIIETIKLVVDILNENPNIHLIEFDNTIKGIHYKVERQPQIITAEEPAH